MKEKVEKDFKKRYNKRDIYIKLLVKICRRLKIDNEKEEIEKFLQSNLKI